MSAGLPLMWHAKTCMVMLPPTFRDMGLSLAAMLAQLSPAMHAMLHCHQVVH